MQICTCACKGQYLLCAPWRNGTPTDLTGIRVLGPHDPPRDDVNVGVVKDDCRALASEFERQRRQVFGGGARDNLGDPAGTGVKDVVELELEERRRLVDRAEDGDERRRVEVDRQEVGDEAGGVRRLFRGLWARGQPSVHRERSQSSLKSLIEASRTLTSAVHPAAIAPRSGINRSVIGSAGSGGECSSQCTGRHVRRRDG